LENEIGERPIVTPNAIGCICIYIYVSTYMNISIYICIYKYVYMYVYVRIYIYLYICMYIWCKWLSAPIHIMGHTASSSVTCAKPHICNVIHVALHTYTHVRDQHKYSIQNIYIYTYIYICIYIYIHTYIYIHIYIYYIYIHIYICINIQSRIHYRPKNIQSRIHYRQIGLWENTTERETPTKNKSGK